MVKKLLLVPLAVLLVVLVLGTNAYMKSQELKKKGDDLVNSGDLSTAIFYYKEAYNLFPLNQSINDDINAAELRFNSEIEYSRIINFDYSEVQTLPSLENIAPVQLKDGEVFVPILMYHHIRVNPKPNDPVWASLNVTPDLLNSELNYLSTNGFHVISLDDLYAVLNGEPLPSKPIVLTFDDGYSNFFETAYPLLKKYNMKATEFVITEVETAPAYLSWGQIEEMSKSGLIDFGAHTQHHPFLTSLSQATARREITVSKSELETHVGKPVRWFAYPYGSYNDFVVNETKNAGYVGAVTTNYGAVISKDKLFLLPRIMADGRFTLDEFARRIQQ